MVIPEFHLKPRGNRWAVIQKIGKRNKMIGVYTRPTAILRGRFVARTENGTLTIHGDNGIVVDRHVFVPATAAEIISSLHRAYELGAGC